MTGPSSERTADADVATVREECAKLISAGVDPLLESGSLPPMWPWWLPLVDAISDRLVAGGTPSSSDPDLGGASPEGNGGVRGAAALDRLVARNQQLQEALERILAADTGYHFKGEAKVADIARAALASVRASEKPSEFAWLVERGQPENQTPTVWLDDSSAYAGWYGEWTEDANRATKFASREDAEAWMKQHPGSAPARATEHGFMSAGGREPT